MSTLIRLFKRFSPVGSSELSDWPGNLEAAFATRPTFAVLLGLFTGLCGRYIFSRSVKRIFYSFLVTGVYARALCWGFWSGWVEHSSCFPNLLQISWSVRLHFFHHCGWWSFEMYQRLFVMCGVSLFSIFVNAIFFNVPELLNKFVSFQFICSVSWHVKNNGFLLLSRILLIRGRETFLAFAAKGPTKFSF